MSSRIASLPDTDHDVAALAPAAGNSLGAKLPGLLLVAAITALAYALRQIPGIGLLSPMILAIVIGTVFHNTMSTPLRAKPGVQFSMRRLLRIAIVLLGLQLTFAQLVAVGGRGMAIIATTLVATFLFTRWLGARLGVERKLAELIAAGTSICGASAVIATNTVTRGSDEDVAYAVACVTVFGSLAMFVLPLLAGVLQLDAHAFGLWSGASIHEIAQVVAAAFQRGQQAGEFGTIAKLSRVMLLAPVVLTLGWRAARSGTGGGDAARNTVPVPWFVIGFVALAAINSLVTIPAPVLHWMALLTTILLTMALAAMGLETDIRKLRAKGLRPFALGALAWLFIAGFSLSAIKLFA
ncbi:YeiH family protein [Cognatiluteimonas profundi]|uniref:YeiH family protein n=1 Tax=Cognatiluteimonas profundi TaxID=2594501 RepID=UPI00131BFAFF|nr:YeiH family protein [Lysobacter profundi]